MNSWGDCEFGVLCLKPALWVDASDSSTLWSDEVFGLGNLVAPNGTVQRIEDKSGNGRRLTKGNPSFSPYRRVGVRNGLDALEFDSTRSTSLSNHATGLDIFRNVSGATIFTAFRFRAVPSIREIIFHAANALVIGSSRVLVDVDPPTATLYRLGSRRLDADAGQNIFSSKPPNTQAVVNTSILDYGNSNSYIYINGELSASSSTFQTDGLSSDTDSLQYSIGARTDSGGGTALAPSNIDFYEAVVFNYVLSERNRIMVEKYLQKKWAIY
jgi:hypothetical protein